MFVIIKHTSDGKCSVIPEIFRTIEEGDAYLSYLQTKDLKLDWTVAISRMSHEISFYPPKSKCFSHEYILQELTFGDTINVTGKTVWKS